MRQVQHDSWRKKGAYHFFVVFNMKVIFSHIGVSITQKRTPLKTHVTQKAHELTDKTTQTPTPLKTHITQRTHELTN